MINTKLQHFRDALEDFSDDFVLIGGNACGLLAEQRNAEFRDTVDLDIVLIIERWTTEFAQALDSYIDQGGYQGRRYVRGRGGESNVYRFTINESHPNAAIYPKEIELFSRAPDGIQLQAEQRIVPIIAGDRVSNFSAILFDEHYYAYLQDNLVMVDGVRIPSVKCLTALKASAWLGNKGLFEEGKLTDIGTVHKHAFDICRLLAMYDDKELELPQQIPTRVYEDIVEVCGLYENDDEVAVLTAFIADLKLADLPLSFEVTGQLLQGVFVQSE